MGGSPPSVWVQGTLVTTSYSCHTPHKISSRKSLNIVAHTFCFAPQKSCGHTLYVLLMGTFNMGGEI